jgi:adenylate cyclase class IV
MSSKFEIEIKTLLGAEENALKLKDQILEKGGVLANSNKQLNHYFTLSDAKSFEGKLEPYITESDRRSFKTILEEGNNFSVRTRDADGKVILVIKASIGSDTSSNGISRMEFESVMNMSLDELDKLLLDSGLEYQAKWSREREEYEWGDIRICLDKNAGYGYLAEFEKVVEDKSSADATKAALLKTMADFGVEELPQDRLERMFAHYNQNWRDYYGTDKVFNIE